MTGVGVVATLLGSWTVAFGVGGTGRGRVSLMTGCALGRLTVDREVFRLSETWSRWTVVPLDMRELLHILAFFSAGDCSQSVIPSNIVASGIAVTAVCKTGLLLMAGGLTCTVSSGGRRNGTGHGVCAIRLELELTG